MKLTTLTFLVAIAAVVVIAIVFAQRRGLFQQLTGGPWPFYAKRPLSNPRSPHQGASGRSQIAKQ